MLHCFARAHADQNKHEGLAPQARLRQCPRGCSGLDPGFPMPRMSRGRLRLPPQALNPTAHTQLCTHSSSPTAPGQVAHTGTRTHGAPTRPPQREYSRVGTADRCRAGLVRPPVAALNPPRGAGWTGSPCHAQPEDSPGSLQSFDRPPPTHSGKTASTPTVGQV